MDKEKIDFLSPIEQRVLRLRFGIDGERKHTLEEISEEIGRSTTTAWKIVKKALKRLKAPETIVRQDKEKTMKAIRRVERDPVTGEITKLECTRCHQMKKPDRFSKGHIKLGKRSQCKDCEHAYQQKRLVKPKLKFTYKVKLAPTAQELLRGDLEKLGLKTIQEAYLKAHAKADAALMDEHGGSLQILLSEIREHVDNRFFLKIKDHGDQEKLANALKQVDELSEEIIQYQKIIAKKEAVIESYRGIQEELAEERKKTDALKIALNNVQDKRP